MKADDILKGLSDEDINSLKEAASSVFASLSDSKEDKTNEEKEKSANSSFSMPDMETLGKITKLMSVLNRDDSRRSALISALKPYLSYEKQKRADEAMRLIKLMDILPELSSHTGKDGLFGGLF